MSAAILLLSDGRPGHFNQSHSLFAATDPARSTRRVLTLPAPRKRLKHLVLAAFLLARRSNLLLRLLYRAYYGVPLPVIDERLIVSTGGDTLVANLLLAAAYRLPNIFVGKPSTYTRCGVRLLVTSIGAPSPGRVIVLRLGPVAITPRPRTTPTKLRRRVAVLLGGDSNEYHYHAADYRALAIALNSLCHRHGLRLLLTTSRRTAAEGEAILEQFLDPAVVEDCTWYNRAPRPVSQQYCEQADLILCSEDSGTMLVESIGWQKPVVGFHPLQRNTTPFYDNFLAGLADCQVQFCAIAALAELPVQELTACKPPDMSALHAAIARLLPTN